MLDGPARKVVENAIRNVCKFRGYELYAINVRTNHAHSVINAYVHPDKIVNAFKANCTRELRLAGMVTDGQKVWSRGASTRYLWNQIAFKELSTTSFSAKAKTCPISRRRKQPEYSEKGKPDL